MPNVTIKTPTHNRKLEFFAARCEARAHLWAENYLTLHDAVDILQFWAVDNGLVDQFGQDEIQKIMAEAFEQRRNSL